MLWWELIGGLSNVRFLFAQAVTRSRLFSVTPRLWSYASDVQQFCASRREVGPDSQKVCTTCLLFSNPIDIFTMKIENVLYSFFSSFRMLFQEETTLKTPNHRREETSRDVWTISCSVLAILKVVFVSCSSSWGRNKTPLRAGMNFVVLLFFDHVHTFRKPAWTVLKVSVFSSFQDYHSLFSSTPLEIGGRQMFPAVLQWRVRSRSVPETPRLISGDMEEYAREPWWVQRTVEIVEPRIFFFFQNLIHVSCSCSPWRIVDDCGGAFAMGAIGGSVFQVFRGFRNAPSVSSSLFSLSPDALWNLPFRNVVVSNRAWIGVC